MTGNDIASIRKKYGLKRKPFARLLGMDPHLLKAYEKGRQPVAREHRQQLRQISDPRYLLQRVILQGHRLSRSDSYRLVQELSRDLPALPAPPRLTALPPHQETLEESTPTVDGHAQVAAAAESPAAIPPLPSAPDVEPLLRELRKRVQRLTLLVFLLTSISVLSMAGLLWMWASLARNFRG